MAGKGLLLVDSQVVEGRLVGEAAELFSLPAENVDVVSCSGRLGNDALPKGAYTRVLSLAFSPGHHSTGLLSLISAALRPGMYLTVKEPRSPQGERELHSRLLLSGFVVKEDNTELQTDTLALTAHKVSWENGSKAAISVRKTAGVSAVLPKAPAAWSVDLDDDEELVDDEELLTEEDRKRPIVPESDCGPGGGKKACANCSCGRAEAEAAGVKAALTLEMLENPQSSCGSCGMGDAFRCATCPYRGLPGFEMGKKIELPTDFLTADA